MRTKPQRNIRSKQFAKNEFHSALEVANGDIAIHVKALDLLKGGIVGGVRVVAAVNAPRGNDSDRRRAAFHGADLDGGRVGTQQAARMRLPEVECILCIARRVVRWSI